MGKPRKVNRRGQSETDAQAIATVEGLAYAIKLGIAVIPKSVYAWRHTIWEAMDGNLEPIQQALIKLHHDARKLGKTPSRATVLDRWKSGMRNHIEGTYYVLSMYAQLFAHYWELTQDAIDTKPEGIRTRTNRNPHCLRGVAGFFNKPNYPVRATIRL